MRIVLLSVFCEGNERWEYFATELTSRFVRLIVTLHMIIEIGGIFVNFATDFTRLLTYFVHHSPVSTPILC